MARMSTCLWFDHGKARAAAEFYAGVFPDTQAETDRYWNAIVGNGGAQSLCGWCRDRWGFSWQIVPRALMAGMTDTDQAAARPVMEAMMTMHKIDIAKVEAARAGQTADA